MTLILPHAAIDPQTHALIIGVSSYPHLPAGAKYDTEPAVRDFGLAQITSTVESATAVAEWLLTKHRNPATPLGTLRLLLSGALYTPSIDAARRLGMAHGRAISVAEPVFGNIESEARQWCEDISRNTNNIAILYFAGHGLEADDRYLLPADYGSDPGEPYKNLINITITHSNLRAYQAQTQCIFLDACRYRPAEFRLAVAEAGGTIGRPVVPYKDQQSSERDAPIYHAATRGGLAKGPAGEISYFTQALLNCLNGSGARSSAGVELPIDQASLGQALREMIVRVSSQLRCDIGGEANLPTSVDLHLASAPVQVLGVLDCLPRQALESAVLACVDAAGTRQCRSGPEAAPWRFVVPGGPCEIGVSFDPADRWRDHSVSEIAAPPLFKRTLEVADKP